MFPASRPVRTASRRRCALTAGGAVLVGAGLAGPGRAAVTPVRAGSPALRTVVASVRPAAPFTVVAPATTAGRGFSSPTLLAPTVGSTAFPTPVSPAAAGLAPTVGSTAFPAPAGPAPSRVFAAAAPSPVVAGAALSPASTSSPIVAGARRSSPSPTAAAASAAPAAATTSDPLAAAGLPSVAAWTTAVRQARSFARGRGARVRFALQVDGHSWSFRGHETTHANSLVKATVLVAYLRRGSVRGRALTGRERALLSPMIRRSENAPVSTLIGEMGGIDPLRRVGRRVGMHDFRPVSGWWGASRVSAIDEARLFARLWTVLPPRHRRYALGLLGSITPSQRWGMPKAAPRGWLVRFKSGWNDRGRVLQAMRLSCRGHVIGVSVLVDGGTHEGSVATVERTGRRLLHPLRVRGRRACATVLSATG